uniref:alpha/beta hydrolase n=1 Tax=Flavobacterium sp. TaxID=239 RepID=UPI00404AA292
MKWTIIGMLCLLVFLAGCLYVKAQNRFQTFNIDAPQLNTEKLIWVYTPRNYNPKKRKKYPVLYMHDGQNLMDGKTAYAGTWKVCETLDSLKIDIIVIGIAHGNEKRLDELTPFSHPKHGGGQADAYLQFVFETLKPYVDKNYKTKSDAENTLLMGSSLGGLVSFYATMKYSEKFEKVAVFSPSFWFTADIYQMAKNEKSWTTKTYLMCGDSESENLVAEVNQMHEIITAKAKNENLIKLKIVPNGTHQEWLWAQEFGEAVQWLLKN